MARRIALLVVILIVIGLSGSVVMALPPMGPPRAQVGQDQWAVDVGVSHSRMDLEAYGKAREDPDGAGWLPPSHAVHRIEDYTSNMLLGRLSFGAYDTVDVFDKQYEFIVEAGVQRAMIALLLAIEKTPLYERLEQEGRLVPERLGCDNLKLACAFINICYAGITEMAFNVEFLHVASSAMNLHRLEGDPICHFAGVVFHQGGQDTSKPIYLL